MVPTPSDLPKVRARLGVIILILIVLTIALAGGFVAIFGLATVISFIKANIFVTILIFALLCQIAFMLTK